MADWTLLREVVEIESGKRADRPKLEEALALCRVHSAKLIIAKLDSLARNVAFVSNLLKEGAHELPGVDRADPPDHPKGQVFFDAFGRCRCGGAQEPGLELLAMGAVVDPFPVAVIHSPAAMVAEWPTTVTNSRCPRALVRRTQKPFSALWKVTRSTRPARASWVGDAVAAFMGDVRDARVPCVVTKACGVPRAEAGRDASIGSRALSPKAGLAGSICWFDLASLLGLSVTAIGSLS